MRERERERERKRGRKGKEGAMENKGLRGYITRVMSQLKCMS